MKVALVYFRLTVQAGGQQQVYSLAQELTRQGHTVVLYTAEIKREIYPALLQGIDVRVVSPEQDFAALFPVAGDGLLVRVSKKRKLDALYTSTARRIAEAMEKDFDAVNCHEDFAYKTGYFYKRINPRARVVWTMNNPAYMRFPKDNFALDALNKLYIWYKDAVERKYFRAVDAVAVLSRYEEKWAKDRHLPVSIVWSGIDFKRFYAPAKTQPGNPAVLMGLGALAHPRRYEDIIDAVALLKQQGHAVRAKIIAKDVWNQAEYRAFLRARVAAGGVEQEVQFNFDGVSEQGLRDAYRTSDVFLLTAHVPPPQGYGWGSAAFEAAAAGLPVVLNRETGAAHILTDNGNALFASPGKPEEYTSQIARLLTGHTLYARIAEEGQRFVRENLSWERYAKEMLALYEGTSNKEQGTRG